MCGTIICVAAVMLGIDVGWQRLPDGGLEYIIQIQPHMLETLKAGSPIASDIPPHLRDVRGYRIVVGTARLPRESLPEVTPQRHTDPFSLSPGGLKGESSAFASPSDSGRKQAPGKLFPDPTGKPLKEQQAAYVESKDVPEEPEKTESDAEKSSDEGSSKPWLPLTLALAGLFGSLGGNLYLGWIHWGTRSRYRALLRESFDPASEPPTDGEPELPAAADSPGEVQDDGPFDYEQA